MTKSNRLCNCYVQNTSEKSHFEGFQVVTCREMPDYEGGTIIEEVRTAEEFLNTDEEALDDPFYRIYAIYKDKAFKTRKAIGDFHNIVDATIFLEELTGNKVYIYSY